LYRSRKEILAIGVVYVLSTYLVYLTIGLGLAQVIKLSGFFEIAAKTFGAIAIGLGILNIVGAVSQRLSKFSPRMSQRLFIPIATQFSSSWIQKSTIGAALLFGFLARLVIA
jgi:cytochrome c biogenesis protein CcdA